MTEYHSRWRYLRSRNEQVVALAEQYERDSEQWVRRLQAFAARHHVRPACTVSSTGDRSVIGVDADAGLGDLPGKWRRPDKGVRRPYESNRKARRLLRSLALRAPEMPGVKSIVVVELDDGRSFFCGTTFFISHGTVWARAGASAEPDPIFWRPVDEERFMEARNRMLEEQRAQGQRPRNGRIENDDGI